MSTRRVKADARKQLQQNQGILIKTYSASSVQDTPGYRKKAPVGHPRCALGPAERRETAFSQRRRR